MKLRFIVWTVLIAILSLGCLCPAVSATSALSPSPDMSEEDIKYLIVMIDATLQGSASKGAGIICGADSDSLYIVTAYHVVRRGTDEAQEIQLQFRSLPGKRVSAMLMPQADKDLDLAVLRVNGLNKLGLNVESLPFERLGSPDSLKRGNEIYMLGYAEGKKWSINTTPERFAGSEGDWIKFESRLITGGNSGGALLDANRDLVGMVRADEPPNGEAVSITSVIHRLREWRYPVRLGELDSSPMRFSMVSAGTYSVCGVTTSGTAYCWGRISAGDSMIFIDQPRRVWGGLTFKTVSVAVYHACGVTTDGVAYCWGSNTYGALGDGSNRYSFNPVPVSGHLTFQSLSAGLHVTLGVTADGKVYSWGYEGLEPRLMPGSAGFASVSTYQGFNFGISRSGVTYSLFYDRAPERYKTEMALDSVGGRCSIATNGAAYCWNFDGAAPRLLRVPTPDGTFLPSVSGIYDNPSCAVDSSGAIRCWNDATTISGSDRDRRFSKISAPGGRAFRAVSVGDGFVCGITVDSALYCWGGIANHIKTEPGKNYGTAPVLITRK